ncbi:MAG: hypothetical protein KKD36_09485 [Bacteroidetes bacterium]|nr:hypothetical protein [Bacteroidota bacterium]
MNITIDFFQGDLIQAIGAGIYEISVHKNGKSDVLYIGESVFVLARCSLHLYQLKKKPDYFGFDKHTIRDSSISIKFGLLKKVDKDKDRKKLEKDLIKKKKPLSQSGISDYQKSVEDKISSLTNFLNSSLTNE